MTNLITMQAFSSPGSGTWNKPLLCTSILVEMEAGGGGGGADHSVTGTAGKGSKGGDTIFNSTVTAIGGEGGDPGTKVGGSPGAGGYGGTGTMGTFLERLKGNDGFPDFGTRAGLGGSSILFGGAIYGADSEKGAGGCGAIGNAQFPGLGGGAGEIVRFYVQVPLLTTSYSFVIGAAGDGGTGDVANGFKGADGYIRITEYYL